jgi:hypothetical protein
MTETFWLHLQSKTQIAAARDDHLPSSRKVTSATSGQEADSAPVARRHLSPMPGIESLPRRQAPTVVTLTGLSLIFYHWTHGRRNSSQGIHASNPNTV